MTAPRFYCQDPISGNQTLTLPTAVAHHVRVRRLAAGCEIVLFDGRGGEIPGVLDFDGKTAQVRLSGHRPREAELAGKLTLIQGLPSGDKMDWVIEKAVELGVQRVIPISAHRSVLKLSGDRLTKRLLHWQGIAIAASEQCGRNHLMQILPPQSLEHTMAQTDLGLVLLCDPAAHGDLATTLHGNNDAASTGVSFLVGPEGGWSTEELDSCRRHQVKSVRFGSRVLRSETAGLAMAAATTALLGW
jgi:16S rRNA (uracil1498-N3)-methyltransferase